ncbi:hypothetical protein, partial [Nocardia brasiliensis]|uniref:hypothetical protein n=1 Tax=Nocardia brasiliensis TaxID=37326 RepID=UPI002456F04F
TLGLGGRAALPCGGAGGGGADAAGAAPAAPAAAAVELLHNFGWRLRWARSNSSTTWSCTASTNYP